MKFTHYNFPPKGTTAFKFWRMKLLLLLIANMQKMFRFAMLDIKLWLKDGIFELSTE